MKNRQGAWLQREGLAQLFRDIKNDTNPELQAMFQNMPERPRGALLLLQTQLQDGLLEEPQSKLQFHRQCPYSVISIYRGEVPG